ncbi:hypothetical protein K523DRAFT_244282 [Schizophyllum commune Tattone D]|uniref:uncharacterized protein n=1 Tax=Schizophyllum commune (strain H4-8 / FGSC 9210) TaxID=578458 RepID=UPI00215F462A|nr:uncharacterized protein SCHCODRAFT_02490035 [Schizophyllum commune H4-8]KAI4522890.1 hypothetical protein K525DRAFT_197731 [Schizophyllum commune Loenen D]KAI5828551.1 hypothetical protein K523DRAFT_244282 [Schizophyllum commune Tattone D]KAI5897455.1 hypothetical protein SCHCODRAFT_02490035 [Schizophyllum commune H4-8]
MPKAKSYTRKNFYAVRVGREGPKVYTTWEDCLRNTSRFPGNSYKGYATLKEAEDWIAPFVNNAPPPAPTAPSRPPRPQANVAPPAPSQLKDTPSVKLSQTQQQVFNRVKKGQNVFFTGSAGASTLFLLPIPAQLARPLGTGKSLLMREIINYKGGRISTRLAITAATGIAACNIGGTTLHSWAGIGRGIKDGWDFAGKMLGLGQTVMKKVLERWRMVDTLIIDESESFFLHVLPSKD